MTITNFKVYDFRVEDCDTTTFEEHDVQQEIQNSILFALQIKDFVLQDVGVKTILNMFIENIVASWNEFKKDKIDSENNLLKEDVHIHRKTLPLDYKKIDSTVQRLLESYEKWSCAVARNCELSKVKIIFHYNGRNFEYKIKNWRINNEVTRININNICLFIFISKSCVL